MLQSGSIEVAKAATVFRAVSEALYSVLPVSQRYVGPVSNEPFAPLRDNKGGAFSARRNMPSVDLPGLSSLRL